MEVAGSKKVGGKVTPPSGEAHLTEPEIDVINRQKESCLQVILKEKMSITEVAKMFTSFGDIQVVKSDDKTYWIDVEDFDKDALPGAAKASNGTNNSNTKIAQMKKMSMSSVSNIKSVKLYHEAERFGH